MNERGFDFISVVFRPLDELEGGVLCREGGYVVLVHGLANLNIRWYTFNISLSSSIRRECCKVVLHLVELLG